MLFLIFLLAVLTLPMWLPLVLKLVAKYFLKKHLHKIKNVVAEEVILTTDGYFRKTMDSSEKKNTQQPGKFQDSQITDATIIE